jgi:hypothetical protein
MSMDRTYFKITQELHRFSGIVRDVGAKTKGLFLRPSLIQIVGRGLL